MGLFGESDTICKRGLQEDVSLHVSKEKKILIIKKENTFSTILEKTKKQK